MAHRYPTTLLGPGRRDALRAAAHPSPPRRRGGRRQPGRRRSAREHPHLRIGGAQRRGDRHPARRHSPPQARGEPVRRALRARPQLHLEPPQGLAAWVSGAEGKGPREGARGGVPALAQRHHRLGLAADAHLPVALRAGGEGAGARPLGAHRGADRRGSPLERGGADHGGAVRAAPAPSQGPAHAGGRTRGQRHGLRRPGHVDLVRQPLQQRRTAHDRRAGPRRRGDDRVREELRWLLQLLEPVLPRTRAAAARERAEGVRVAVRLRHRPRGRGRTGRARGGGGSRLPRDRRGGRVRRPLWLCAEVHRNAQSQGRPRLPGGPRVVPLRGLPRVLPLLRLPRPERRAVQRAADVLEGHRHLGGRRVLAHLRAEPHLRTPDRTTGPNLQRTLELRTGGIPLARGRVRRPRRVVVGLAGNVLARVDGAGRTAQHEPHCALAGADLAAAEPGREGRSGAVAAGAPGERRSPASSRPGSSTPRPPPTWSSSRPRTASPPAARPTRAHGRAAGAHARGGGLDRNGPVG